MHADTWNVAIGAQGLLGMQEHIMNTEQHIRAYLAESFATWQLNPDTTYVNGLIDVIHEQMAVSRTLVEEGLHWFERAEEPTYDQGLVGLFYAPDTFDPADRVHGLELRHVERIFGEMIASLR
ncbi:hypothetical protein [Pseudomonas sp. BP8]|uniref:hypothetical protein n=1 Tax=Pseudomonas sp. BP8 TaxID=2817864 RepID=UPI001AE5952F|nr:hypothetical protein [Pseudomonas sp. BP8]HDS1738059.1 hypothetical protein [Pseudomonas putida]